MKETLYVTGSEGLVGSEFVKFSKNNYQLITPEINTLDISNFVALEKYFQENKLSAIVNFAALTNVDGAEKEKGNKKGPFWLANVIGAVNLARLAKDKSAHMIQISTDFVFPGSIKLPGPYSEKKEPPKASTGIGWYGWTKRIAEKKIQEIISPAIVRISFPFGNSGSPKDYLNKLISGINKGYSLFNNQKITPTYMPDLFYAIEKILQDRLTGVFHVTTFPITTPFEIGRMLTEKLNLDIPAKSGSVLDFLKKPGVAPRPIRGGLRSKETQRILGIKFHSWQEGLDAWL